MPVNEPLVTAVPTEKQKCLQSVWSLSFIFETAVSVMRFPYLLEPSVEQWGRCFLNKRIILITAKMFRGTRCCLQAQQLSGIWSFCPAVPASTIWPFSHFLSGIKRVTGRFTDRERLKNAKRVFSSKYISNNNTYNAGSESSCKQFSSQSYLPLALSFLSVQLFMPALLITAIFQSISREEKLLHELEALDCFGSFGSITKKSGKCQVKRNF